MTTWVLYTSKPDAGDGKTGQAAPALSGLSLDDSVTNTGASKSLLDEYVGSTATIKVTKLLMDLERGDKFGRRWLASSDGGTTFIKGLE